MARPKAQYLPNQVRHLTFRGSQKDGVFRDESDYAKYYDLLLFYTKRHAVLIRNYCLMPNHSHMKILTTNDKLRNFKHDLQLAYAKYFCKKYVKVGHIWQGHPKSPLIEDDAYDLACSLYIEANPVEAGLVTAPEKWRWSSYRHHAFGEIDPLISTDPLFKHLGKNQGARQNAYRKLFAGRRRKTKLR